ncbi:MAG: hypothetical protein WCI55_16890 [Armatimonadota bacterium]
MLNLMLINVLDSMAKDKLLFEYRLKDKIVWQTVGGPPNSKRSIIKKLILDGSWGLANKSFNAAVRKVNNVATIEFFNDRGNNWKLKSMNGGPIGSSSNSEYFFDHDQSITQIVSSAIYKVSADSFKLLGKVPGRALDVIGNSIVTATSDREIQCLDVNNFKVQSNDVGLSRRIVTLYRKRLEFSISDQYWNRSNGNIPLSSGDPQDYLRINSDGKYWFEGEARIFKNVVEKGLLQYFAGDVLLSGKGLEWQWKYRGPGLLGSYFPNESTFRFCRNDRFLMGSKKLSWYAPGVYDINLKTNTVRKLSTDPIKIKDIVEGRYALLPN